MLYYIKLMKFKSNKKYKHLYFGDVNYPDRNPPPYPHEIYNVNFNKFVRNNYSDYTIPRELKSYNELCSPQEFNLSLPQQFLGKYISDKAQTTQGRYDSSTDCTFKSGECFSGILMYHGLGSGKTCASIVIAEGLKKQKMNMNNNYHTTSKIIVVVPKQVKQQYYNELRGLCPTKVIIDGKAQSYSIKGNTEKIKETKELILKINKQQRQPNLTDAQKQKFQKQLNTLKNNLRSYKIKQNSKINEYYEILSHNEFINRLYPKDPTDHKLTLQMKELKNPNNVLIIDEIQNLISSPIFSNNVLIKGNAYWKLYTALHYYAHPNLRTVLLSGTPISNDPFEIGLMINLLRPRIPFPLNQTDFNTLFLDIQEVTESKKPTKNDPTKIKFKTVTYKGMKNKNLFRQMINGYISYFAGGNPIQYPRQETHYIKSVMSSYQESIYEPVYMSENKGFKNITKNMSLNEVLQLLNQQSGAVFTKSRQFSNIAFETSIDDIVREIKNENNFENKLKIINKYSCKFASFIRHIYNNKTKPSGPIFVYVSFAQDFGAHGLGKILEACGAIPYKKALKDKQKSNRDNSPNGIGAPYKYAIWTGETSEDERIQIQQLFNDPKNTDGNIIKILIGTDAISVGVNLLRATQAHLIDQWWNENKTKQIIYRVIRRCGHKDTKNNDCIVKYNNDSGCVQIFYHMATLREDFLSIDQRILNSAKNKQFVINKFLNCLKEQAIDCSIFRNGNVKRLTKSQDGFVYETNDIQLEDIKCRGPKSEKNKNIKSYEELIKKQNKTNSDIINNVINKTIMSKYCSQFNIEVLSNCIQRFITKQPTSEESWKKFNNTITLKNKFTTKKLSEKELETNVKNMDFKDLQNSFIDKSNIFTKIREKDYLNLSTTDQYVYNIYSDVKEYVDRLRNIDQRITKNISTIIMDNATMLYLFVRNYYNTEIFKGNIKKILLLFSIYINYSENISNPILWNELLNKLDPEALKNKNLGKAKDMIQTASSKSKNIGEIMASDYTTAWKTYLNKIERYLFD